MDDDATREAVARLNDAINRHDVDGLMAAFADDCVFENTGPVPDGQRFEGQAAVRAFWERWFAANPDARFEAEEVIVAGERCVVRWVYRKVRNAAPWHLRGVDVLRVQHGRVTEKLAYAKG